MSAMSGRCLFLWDKRLLWCYEFALRNNNVHGRIAVDDLSLLRPVRSSLCEIHETCEAT